MGWLPALRLSPESGAPTGPSSRGRSACSCSAGSRCASGTLADVPDDERQRTELAPVTFGDGEPQVVLETAEEVHGTTSADYRQAAAGSSAVLRVARRPALAPPPPAREKGAWSGLLFVVVTGVAFGAISIGLAVQAGDALGWGIFGAMALFFLGVMVALPLALASGKASGSPRLPRGERLDEVVRVEVGAFGIRTTPRADEDWEGTAGPEEVEEVYAQPWHGGVVRVRVALRSGHHVTLVDGLASEDEAEQVASAVTRRLRREA